MKDRPGIKGAVSIPLRTYILTSAIFWTLTIAVLLMWNLEREDDQALDSAHIQARSSFDKDVLYRSWNAGHGGVYAPVSGDMQPNPYLDVPERDIVTTSGQQLTMINPAFMIRQVHELGQRDYGTRAHITSLNPIRPDNAPDPWERNALQAFERGDTESSSSEEINGMLYLRLMRPLITEKKCLKCHAAQGYEEGDIRGGISNSVPMAPHLAIAQSHKMIMWRGFGLIWLLGIAGIVFAAFKLNHHIRERDMAQEAWRQAKKTAEDASRAKSEFLASMSHE
ncbi:MAG: DUF3365 domain-containing protein, partial [Desulfobacterales bacterium]